MTQRVILTLLANARFTQHNRLEKYTATGPGGREEPQELIPAPYEHSRPDYFHPFFHALRQLVATSSR